MLSGRHSSGIAWWINGTLIPYIQLERGKTYVFAVEGGNDPDNPARNHPLYITDDAHGGYGRKSVDDRALETVYAGVDAAGEATAGKTVGEGGG